jgi:ACR3 family arsenite efflux pump ArsB
MCRGPVGAYWSEQFFELAVATAIVIFGFDSRT